MQRREMLNEIKGMFGFVPGFAEEMDDSTLEGWLDAGKNFWMKDSTLPVKTKALLGLASAATMRCRYWVPFFTGLAQLSGATQQEIKEAIRAASIVARDSVYMNGIDYPIDKFTKELNQIQENARKVAVR